MSDFTEVAIQQIRRNCNSYSGRELDDIELLLESHAADRATIADLQAKCAALHERLARIGDKGWEEYAEWLEDENFQLSERLARSEAQMSERNQIAFTLTSQLCAISEPNGDGMIRRESVMDLVCRWRRSALAAADWQKEGGAQ